MKKYGLPIIVLALLIGLLYGSSLNNSWHFDDYPNIEGNYNIHLKSLSWDEITKSFQGISEASMRRPLSYFSFALNYYAGQQEVFGYHVVNIAIHYLASLFLFLFVFEVLNLPLLKKDYGRQAYAIACLAVVLWAVNPLQVTAVTYIVQRMTSLCALFYIMAMFFYVKARRALTIRMAVIYMAICLLAALSSFASKENGAMLPVSLLLLDLIVIQGVKRESVKKSLFFITIIIGFVLVISLFLVDITTILDGYQMRPFTLGERLLTQPRVILFYMSLLLYPTPDRLTLLHDIKISTSLFYPWTTLPAIALLMAMIVLALALIKKKPLITFCILFFFVNHFIEGSFMPLEIIYEHRNYLPSMLFFVPVAIGVMSLFNCFVDRPVLKGIVVFAVVLMVITQGLTVITRNDVFRTERSLWLDNVAKAPDLMRPHHNLGVVYLARGALPEGRDELLKALHARDNSGRHNKTHTLFYLGQYYRMIGNDDEAMKLFKQAIDMASFNPEPYQAIAEILLKQDDLAGAEQHIGRALTLNPKEGRYHLTYSAVLLRKGWPDAAIAEAKRAITWRGDTTRAYLLIAEAYDLKKDKAAAALYREKGAEEHRVHQPKR